MNALRLRLTTAAVAVAAALTSLAPAQAFEMPSSPAGISSVQSPVTDVQYRRGWRGDRDGYYNGHRGYRDRRPGYRQHNGMWFPLAAFATGAIISGAIAADRAPRGHVAWCESRYRTYRASDNTYVASAGVRRSCVSPR